MDLLFGKKPTTDELVRKWKRELRKEVERALTMAGAESIEVRHFSPRVRESAGEPPAAGPRSMAEVERRHLLSVLQEADWNVVAAARILGLHRNTLTRRIEQYGLRKS